MFSKSGTQSIDNTTRKNKLSLRKDLSLLDWIILEKAQCIILFIYFMSLVFFSLSPGN